MVGRPNTVRPQGGVTLAEKSGVTISDPVDLVLSMYMINKIKIFKKMIQK